MSSLLRASALGCLLFAALLAQAIPFPAVAASDRITITTNSDFLSCGCVSGGTGSPSSPYVLSHLTLYSKTGPGLLVDNTLGGITVHFVLQADTITGGKGPTTNFAGVEFVHVAGLGSITGALNTFNGNKYGILLLYSSGILIDGVSDETGSTANSNGVAGVSIVGGSSNTLLNMQISHNGIGIPENFFGGGVGIQLNRTSGNSLTNLILSEDGYSGLASFGSSGNVLTNLVVHYPDFYGAIIDGGSGNTIQRSTFQTGDYVGLWLRDGTSSNLVQFDSIYANGPTGKEIKPAIVPFFTVGLYLSSGAHDNLVEHLDFNNGNTGGSVIQDNGAIMNAVQSPTQSNNPFNEPGTGNELASPLFPSGPTGSGNYFCGNAIVSSQGVSSNPPC